MGDTEYFQWSYLIAESLLHRIYFIQFLLYNLIEKKFKIICTDIATTFTIILTLWTPGDGLPTLRKLPYAARSLLTDGTVYQRGARRLLTDGTVYEATGW